MTRQEDTELEEAEKEERRRAWARALWSAGSESDLLLDRIIAERDAALVEAQRLRNAIGALAEQGLSPDAIPPKSATEFAWVVRLIAQRDEAWSNRLRTIIDKGNSHA